MNKQNLEVDLVDISMPIEETKHNLKAVALLEAIISPDWESRYFSYNSHWTDSTEMASMRNGEGTSWHMWFKDNIMAWKFTDYELGTMDDIEGTIQNFPHEFADFYNEPAFQINEATCLWYFKDNSWSKFGIESERVEVASQVFHWTARDYKEWAESYYGKDISLDTIQAIFNEKVTEELLLEINPDISLDDLMGEFEEIGVRI